jgi:hypothetical protein
MVQKLNVQIDLPKLLQLYQHAEAHFPWTDSFPTLQSGISVAPGKKDDLLGCCGGNFTEEQEHLYNQLHSFYQDSYISELSSLLHLKIFRLRWMKLSEKSCYSFHKDWSKRLHIPIITSKDSYFLFQNPLELAQLEENHAYVVDTTRVHTAINTGSCARVHLIACCSE